MWTDCVYRQTDSPCVYTVYHNGRDSSSNNNTTRWLISSSRTTVSCDLKNPKAEHELKQTVDIDFGLQTLLTRENVETDFSSFLKKKDISVCALAKARVNIAVTHRAPRLFSFYAGEKN